MDRVEPPSGPQVSAFPTREGLIGDGISWTSRWSLRWACIALAAVLLGLVVQQTWVVLFPVVLALTFATVLSPVTRFLGEKVRLPQGLAAGLTLVGTLGLLIGAGFAIAPSVAGQSGELVKSASDGIQEIQHWIQDSNFVTSQQIDSALESVQEKLRGSAGDIAGGVLTGVSAVTNGLVTLVVALILTFLFLKDGSRFLPWVHRMAGPRAGAHLEAVGHRTWATLGSFIRTQALVSFIDAVMIGAGLLIIGVPLAVPLALLTFFGGFIPIVGAFVAGVIAVLVALVSNGFTAALIVLGLVVAVQQIEGNVLSPWLQSKSMNLHAAVVLLSVTLGATLFGITGAFLAVPVAATVAVVLRYLDEVVTARTTPPPVADEVVDDTDSEGAPAPGR